MRDGQTAIIIIEMRNALQERNTETLNLLRSSRARSACDTTNDTLDVQRQVYLISGVSVVPIVGFAMFYYYR